MAKKRKMKTYCLVNEKTGRLSCAKATNYVEASKKLKITSYYLRTYGFIAKKPVKELKDYWNKSPKNKRSVTKPTKYRNINTGEEVSNVPIGMEDDYEFIDEDDY